MRALANPELVIILIGNKNDKGDEREVSYLEASRFAQEHGKNALSLKVEINKLIYIYGLLIRNDVFRSKRTKWRWCGGHVL